LVAGGGGGNDIFLLPIMMYPVASLNGSCSDSDPPAVSIGMLSDNSLLPVCVQLGTGYVSPTGSDG
jgi:hypothetical protein